MAGKRFKLSVPGAASERRKCRNFGHSYPVNSTQSPTTVAPARKLSRLTSLHLNRFPFVRYQLQTDGGSCDPGSRNTSRPGSASPRCIRIYRITTGSSILAMIRRRHAVRRCLQGLISCRYLAATKTQLSEILPMGPKADREGSKATSG